MPDNEDKPTTPPRQPITHTVSAKLEIKSRLKAVPRQKGDRPVVRRVWINNGPVGRPSSRDLIRIEAERRLVEAEVVPPTLKAFANELADWLRTAHPDAPSLRPDTIEDHTRDLWNAAGHT